MAVQTGLGWSTFSVDTAAGSPVDVRANTTNLAIATPRAVQDVTTLAESAMARLLLLADATVTANGVFDTAVSHPVWKTVCSTSVERTVSLGVSSQTLAMEMIATDYSLGRPQDGSLTWAVPLVLSSGDVPAWS